MKPEFYVLIELPPNSRLKFKGRYECFLCPWKDVGSRVEEILESYEAQEEPVKMSFTLKKFTTAELEQFCEEEEIEWSLA